MGCIGYAVVEECTRCHKDNSAVDASTGLCESCLAGAVKVRLQPKPFQMVPDVPTEAQALAVFTFCAETVILQQRLCKLVGRNHPIGVVWDAND